MPDFADIKQKAGLIPVNFKFYPTNHEAMAEGAGQFSWYFEKDKSYTMCLGEKETNGAKILYDNDKRSIRQVKFNSPSDSSL